MSKYNLQRYSRSLVLAYATNATTITATGALLNGRLCGVLVDAPDLDSTNTYTVSVEDADGFSVFSKASLAKNSKSSVYIDANNYPLQLPLSGTYTIKIVTSGNQTANRVFSVSLLIDRS